MCMFFDDAVGPPPVSKTNLVVFCVGVFCLGSGPFPGFASLLFPLAKRKSGQGICVVVGAGGLCFCVCYLICLLYYETKAFHVEFSNLFYSLSQCQDRASERNRPQQRKKNTDSPVTGV